MRLELQGKYELPAPAGKTTVAVKVADHSYLVATEETRPLRLLLLVKVTTSAENACHFFNRREGGRIRFVSYHFDKEARIENDFSDTDEALRSIAAADVAAGPDSC